MINRQSDFITEYRAATSAALKSINDLLALGKEASLNNWPADLNPELAFVGMNQDINVEKLTAAMVAASQILSNIDDVEFAALYKIRI